MICLSGYAILPGTKTDVDIRDV